MGQRSAQPATSGNVPKFNVKFFGQEREGEALGEEHSFAPNREIKQSDLFQIDP